MSAIFLFLLTASSKPVCNAAHHGRLWPEAGNGSPQALRELYRSGVLEMCSAGTWKCKWIPLRVHVHRAGRKHG
jgi:hypothetical protein